MPIDPSRMTAAQAAVLLRVEEALVAADVADGAPIDGAGRLHLVRYASWLIQRLARLRGVGRGGDA